MNEDVSSLIYCFIVSIEERVGWRVGDHSAGSALLHSFQNQWTEFKMERLKLGGWVGGGVSELGNQLLLLHENVIGCAIFTENGSKIMGHGASLVKESGGRVRHFYADFLSICWFIGRYWHSGNGWCVTKWRLTRLTPDFTQRFVKIGLTTWNEMGSHFSKH